MFKVTSNFTLWNIYEGKNIYSLQESSGNIKYASYFMNLNIKNMKERANTICAIYIYNEDYIRL